MKRSTVASVIRKKMTNLLASIDDTAVRDLMARDIIVTGGCVASMMTDEKVNDYDVYFRTREAALAVANYYVRKFNEAVATRSKVKEYAPVVKEITRQNVLGEDEDRIVIWMQSAGVAGEVSEEAPGSVDYDYFESRPEHEAGEFLDAITHDPAQDAEAVREEMSGRDKKTKPRYRPVFISENAITLSDQVQLMIRFWGEPEQLHRNYDYAHAMGYYEHSTGKVTVSAETMECMLSKTLKYKGSLYPIASIFRLRKFLARGWRITAGEMLKIVWQLKGINLDDPAVLREQLLGVDQAYMHQLISELSKAEGRVDATYLAKLIDNLFD